jgi:hypothetical protein
MHRPARTTLMIGLMIFSGVAVAPPSSARTETHCTQQVTVGDHEPPDPVCFSSYPDLIAFLTGGRLHLADDLTTEPDGSGDTALDQQIRTAEVARSVHVISTEYVDANYAGSSFTFTWSSDCTGIDVAWSSMPTGFDNDISSSHTGLNCVAVHYDNTGATPSTPPSGASLSCPTFASCATMGTMNDKTSSMRWTP